MVTTSEVDDHVNASAVDAALASLEEWFRKTGRVTVAFSGGTDSSLLAWIAASVLGDRALVVTAVSPSLAEREARECAELSTEWGLNWRVVHTDEMERAAYRRNDPDRCRHCKSALMDSLAPISDGVIVLGVNLDDLLDHRPGQAAAAEAGARFPFVEVGLDKSMIRSVARRIGLRIWDKPAAACLASRIPHGTEVSVQLLSRVDRAEEVLHRLELGQLRVRSHGDIARIEVEPAHMDVVVRHRAAIENELCQLGFRFVTLDLAGFRSGSLNPAVT